MRRHRNSLPKASDMKSPVLEYHFMAEAFLWEDEGLEQCPIELENAFRYVLYHRTKLIELGNEKDKIDDWGGLSKWSYKLAKKYFPDWIGFLHDRNTYDPILSERIKRIRKVEDWKMEKMMKEQ